jgi:RNA recognition motif-containing protein
MSSRLFIGGISYDTTEYDLQEYFSSFGPITSCTIVYNRCTGISKGYGFLRVNGKSIAAEILASDKHLIKDRLVDVSEALDKEKSAPSHHLLTKGFRRLFVGGLSHKISTNHLLDYFSTFGRVLNAFKISDPITKIDKNFGYVEFETVEAAQFALNTKPHLLYGHKLNVQNHKSGLKASLLLNMKNQKNLASRVDGKSALFTKSPEGQSHRPIAPAPLDSVSADTEDFAKSIPENKKYPASSTSFRLSTAHWPAEGKKPSEKAPDRQDYSSKTKSGSLNTQSSGIAHQGTHRFRIFYRHLRRLGALTNECPQATDNDTYCFNKESRSSYLQRAEQPLPRCK